MLSRRRGRWPAAATWLAWLLPVFAWAPLTYPGYFEFLNGFAPVFNLDDLVRHSLNAGWAPAIGQGYDLLRGEGPLPYLLAALPHALGWSGSASIKLVFAAALLAGAFGMYGWARRSLGAWPGLLAAAVYTFWPLGLATVYVRGAVAEALLLGLLPLAWWAADAAGASRSLRPATGLALVLAAACWTQAGLALWLAASVPAYLLLRTRGRGLLPGLAGWGAGLAAGLLGLLPRALAHGLGGAGYVNFADHFVYPHQLLQAGWGLGPSIAGPYDAMPLQLGLVACGLAALGALLWPGAGQREADPAAADRPGRAPEAPSTADGCIAATRGFAIAAAPVPAVLCLTLATPFWALLPFLSRSLTYPWQLLLLAGPWLAWLAGLGSLSLARLVPAAAMPAPAGLAAAGDLGRTSETARPGLSDPWRAESAAGAQAARPVLGVEESAAYPAALPLFAALIGLALLGVYADLNPPATPVDVERPVAIYGDNQLALVSAVVSPTLTSTVTVRVQWQALRPIDQDYTVFVHAEGPDGSVWGQQDSMPRGGKAPTSGWRPGALMDDQYTLVLKPGAPAGIHYVLGLYQWQTGQRLRTGSDDKIVLQGPDG